MTKEKIKETIRKHKLWLENKEGGGRANFSYEDLTGVDLADAYLSRAILVGVNLSHANLFRTHLYRADMSDANLAYANLTGSDLFGASLFRSDLTGVNLTGACLHGADLTKIKTNCQTRGIHPAPEGELIGWGKKNGKLVKMLIPADAKRSCDTTREHRAEFVKVLWIEDDLLSTTVKNEFAKTVYEIGQIVRCHEWGEDRWKACAGGIHFFLTRAEAEAWG